MIDKLKMWRTCRECNCSPGKTRKHLKEAIDPDFQEKTKGKNNVCVNQEIMAQNFNRNYKI